MSLSRAAQTALLLAASAQGGASTTPTSGRKRAVNVSVDEKVLAEAKELGLNLSQTLETALREMIRQIRIREWSKTNQPAVTSYNTLVAPPEPKS